MTDIIALKCRAQTAVMASTDRPLCKDCMWHKKPWFSKDSICERPVGKSPINGKDRYACISALVERSLIHACGPDGRFFKPRRWFSGGKK